MKNKKTKEDDKSSLKSPWVAIHWLGDIVRLGTEKEIKKFCKENSYNKDHPIHHAVRLDKNSVCLRTCDKCQGKGTVLMLTK